MSLTLSLTPQGDLLAALPHEDGSALNVVLPKDPKKPSTLCAAFCPTNSNSPNSPACPAPQRSGISYARCWRKRLNVLEQSHTRPASWPSTEAW